MTFDPETMTGWDQDITAPSPVQEQTGAVEILLRALHAHVQELPREQYTALVMAMSKVDWHAMNFAQNALDSGEDLYSCYPNNDVLVKYTPPSRPDPDQGVLAF